MVPLATRNKHPAAKFPLSLAAATLLLVLVSPSCSNRHPPELSLEHAHLLFLQGSFTDCQKEVKSGYLLYRDTNPASATKFANQEAECLIWAGSYAESLSLYAQRTLSFADSDSRIRALGLQVSAHTHLEHLKEANRLLSEAENLCQGSVLPSCGNLLAASGMLAIEEDHLELATEQLSAGLAFARSHGDRFLEATTLEDLALVAHRNRHFDESADRNEEAFRLADTLNYRDIAQIAQGNAAWRYYRLGNFPYALELFRSAEQRAALVGDRAAQASWLTGIGKIQFERSEFAAAAAAFQKALVLEDRVNSQEEIYAIEVCLAQMAVQNGDLLAAEQHVEKALKIARDAPRPADELYPSLIQGQIAARRGNFGEALEKFRDVEHNPKSEVFVKWEAQRVQARLAEDQQHGTDADREYRAAIATFEAARGNVQREEQRLSFLSNGQRIYDDYIHFLVADGKADDALLWAEQSRARTLAQGLGFVGLKSQKGPAPLNAQQIAARAGGTLLFYWLGQQQSYLWAITPQKTTLFPLPPAAEIEAALSRYHDTLDENATADLLALPNRDGLWLYRTLVAPAQSLIPKDGRVVILADAGLNNLNFETLIAPDPTPHFWIQDATVICASSLRWLNRPEPQASRKPQRLLLIGNSLAPNDTYPALKGAAEQMKVVSRHFAGHDPRIIEGKNATPGAYLAAHPEQYSIIHFVAHGTASRTSPLESAIVLSRPADGGDSFKLYARDIVPHTIQPDLVVVSACHSAGESAFAGEGLVGLTWGFLRAGARNVIAALGEASATSSVPMMDDFYTALNQGQRPDVALRSAKLNLLRDPRYRSPHYWAPFQLYGTGRMRPVR